MNKKWDSKKKDLRNKKNLFPLAAKTACVLVMLAVFTIPIEASQAAAGGFYLTASWYSVKDLKSSGQWAKTKGVMANGHLFDDTKFTGASRDFPLGAILVISNLQNGKKVRVEITDRINKRFTKTRIDLSPVAFKALAGKQGLSKGLIKVYAEEIK